MNELVRAAQTMRRAQTYTATVVISIGISAGASIAVLAVLDRVLLRPPPGLDNPQALRRLYLGREEWGHPLNWTGLYSYPDYLDLRGAAAPDAQIEGYSSGEVVVREVGRRATAALASPGFLQMVGAGMQRGRMLDLKATHPMEQPQEALISYRFWKSAFGADTLALGRTITLAGEVFTVVGVTEPRFRGVDLEEVDVWLPLRALQTSEGEPWSDRDSRFLNLVARMDSETNDAQLEVKLTMAFRNAHAAELGAQTAARIALGPLPQARGPLEQLPVHGRNVSLLGRLSGISLIVLVIALVNAAGVMLARAVRRRGDIGVRLALGMSRRRLATSLLAEALILAFLSFVFALVVASLTHGGFQRHLLSTVQGEPVGLGLRHIMLTAVITVTLTISAALFPSWLALRVPESAATGGGDPGMLMPPKASLGLSTVLQNAVSLTLLVIAGTFLWSLDRAVAAASVYRQPNLVAVLTRGSENRSIPIILARLRELSFVEAVSNSIAEIAPGRAMTRASAAGSARRELLSYNAVDSTFFSTVGLRAVIGRVFDDRDRQTTEAVAIVTLATARTLWGGNQPAIGKCLQAFGHRCRRVVGVVPDIQWEIGREATPHFYVPLSQVRPEPGRIVLIRTDHPPTPSNLADIEHIVSSVQSDGIGPVVYRVSDRFNRILNPLRAAAALLSVYAVLILLGSVIGTYGRLNYEITQRSREFGVRAALGASPRDLVGGMAFTALRPVGVGLTLGAMIVISGSKLTQPFLFDTSARDPIVLLWGVVLLGLVSVCGIALACARLAKLSPASALRHH